MAASLGPNLTRDGLVLSYDFSDRNTYLPYSLINMSTWTVGIGGATGYNANGNPTSENERFSGTNPWGDTDIIWGSFPSGNGNDDGGWNTTDFNIDNTKLYRFSVWVRRTSSTYAGTFYFGMYANGSGSRRMDNSAAEGNAYWHCSGTGSLTQNVWYLFVGHVYPWETNYTGKHPNTGYYLINNPVKQGEIDGCNIGTGDLKWSSNSTTGVHRTYHYYCADNTTRLQFYDPRVDLIDGTEPTIYELVTRSAVKTRDMTNNSYNGIYNNKPTYTTNNKGEFSFNGTNQYIDCGNVLASLTDLTLECFVKFGTQTQLYGGVISKTLSNANGWEIRVSNYTSTTTELTFRYVGDNAATGFNMNFNNGTWYHIVVTGKNGSQITYVNGVQMASTSYALAPSANSNSLLIAKLAYASYHVNMTMGFAKIYNRVLSAAEILQNYNSTKSKFGL
jgi:hypothetical protein